MMHIDHEAPAWAERTLLPDDPDVIWQMSRVHTDSTREQWLFSGMIGELIRMRKLPLSFDIYLDMDNQATIVRMEYEKGGDGLNKDGKFRAFYAFLGVEDFALLWNCRPESIHGFPAKLVALHFKDNGLPWPSLIAQIPTLLTFDAQADEFRVELDAPAYIYGDPETV